MYSQVQPINADELDLRLNRRRFYSAAVSVNTFKRQPKLSTRSFMKICAIGGSLLTSPDKIKERIRLFDVA